MLSHAVLDGSHLYVFGGADTESSELSGSVSYQIVSAVNTITASHWDEKELLDKAELIDYPVRKCAHMSEYAILTLLGFLTFSFLHGRGRFLIPIGVTFLYACTDEFHQLFVPAGPASLPMC